MPSTITVLRRPWASLLVTGVLALSMALLLSGVASAAPAYHLVNHNSDKGLMPAGHSTAWGARIYQRPLQHGSAQHWFLRYEGNQAYSFRNRNSNLCIHPSNWSPVSGTFLLQASCTTNTNARLWYRTIVNGTSRFLSLKTGLYMDIAGSSTANNATAVQMPFDGSASQRWRLQYAGNF